MIITAISGGIGSGKSVVSRVLEAMGYAVYDCDSRAKTLMDSDPAIHKALRERISPDTVNKVGTINRRRLSEIVFSDAEKLLALNEIVHGSVRVDLKRWCVEQCGSKRTFVETAILYQSELDRMVDEVWEVTAPLQLRIERVMKRNGCEAAEVERRIESQAFEPEIIHPRTEIIINDGIRPVLPRVVELLG